MDVLVWADKQELIFISSEWTQDVILENNKCDLCCQITNEYSKLTQKEYKNKHDWVDRWFIESNSNNYYDMYTTLETVWQNFEIQSRRQDCKQKEKNCH